MSRFFVSDRFRDLYADVYETGASEWRRLGAVDKAENIIRLCERHPHDTILEIGAGEGSLLERLSDLDFGQRLYAAEISETAIETISQRGIEKLAEARLFDGYTLPYQDKQFDLAVLSHVLEHAEYPRRLLYEASRVARLVFVEVPLEHHLRLPEDFSPGPLGHINFFSRKTIRRLIQTCELEIVDQRITNPSWRSYRYRSGRVGMLNYFVKELAIRMAPRLATSLWTYHSSLSCREKASLPNDADTRR